MFKYILIPLVLACSIRGAGLDLVSFSMGPWITLNSSSGGPISKDSYFTTAALSLYFHGLGLKGAASFPVTWTVEQFSNYTRYAVYPADFKFFLGRQAANFEPRIGLSLPARYPTDNASAWIGTGNTKLLLGMGFRTAEHFGGKLAVGGELQAGYCLNGIEDGARFGRGTMTGWGSLKAAWRVSPRVKAGAELFPFASRYTEADWAPDSTWTSFGILPMAFIQTELATGIEIGFKAGYGFDRSEGRQSDVFHGNIAFNYYL